MQFYYCDENYNPLHNCRAQCYALLKREDLETLIKDVCAESGQEDESVLISKVSFNALSSEYNPSTLRLKGLCQGKSVNILVDNGSSFNFVKPTVAQTLGLHQVAIDPFKVFVGSGDFIWCTAKSLGIAVMV